MQYGYNRFEYYLNKISSLLTEAAGTLNPAFYLAQHDARTPFFMLEGLSRLYSNLHNEKKFEKLKVRFKQIEDALGAIDYYDHVYLNVSADSRVPEEVKEYLQAQSREKIQSLNEILVEEGWMGEEARRISKIHEKLSSAEWLSPETEVEKVEALYHKEIAKIHAQIPEAGIFFTEIELQVHELRRDLRWLSIYPQCLRGMIQYHQNGIADPPTDKYLEQDIVNSPYNIFPDAGNLPVVMLLEQKYFFALSWLISRLGRIKDDGLRLMAVSEAFQHLEKITAENALEKTCALLGKDKSLPDQILLEATLICQTFKSEKILEKLLAGKAMRNQ
jgi:hypothetical protein